ncbi:MAG: S-adenosylmethionine:tRNA ribosyltransferase-isomerase, S-adenosylmethionine:tRNA ribosyltransferase-isomerase, partial [Candidatus Peregrinibacteria bacterium GW2011_GWE2_39_6]
MQINEFDYKLPLELIAQNPLEKRDDARLMVLDRINKSIEHKKISDLPGILNPNTVLFFNNTLVFPARLYGEISQKKVEILLHQEKSPGKWECLVRPGKRFRVGTKISWPELEGTVIEINEDGSRLIEFSLCGANFTRKIDAIGQVPLPPYIKKSTSRPDQYQTIYAQKRGSVAAPTAGLHFTPDLMKNVVDMQKTKVAIENASVLNKLRTAQSNALSGAFGGSKDPYLTSINYLLSNGTITQEEANQRLLQWQLNRANNPAYKGDVKYSE